MSKCDLCGGTAPASSMTELQKQFQVAGIADICPSCEKWANKKLNEIRDRVAPAMRQEIASRAGREPFSLSRLFRLTSLR